MNQINKKIWFHLKKNIFKSSRFYFLFFFCKMIKNKQKKKVNLFMIRGEERRRDCENIYENNSGV